MPEPTVDDDAPAARTEPAAPRSTSRWVAPAALVIALIAAATAGWAALRPPPAADKPAAETPSAEAKANACSAFQVVTNAVALQTHANAGTEPAAIQAVAANARLAMAGGGTYLLAKTSPGTPPELADAMRSFASSLQDIAINALAGVTNDNPAQAARLRDAEATNAKIAALCK